MNTVTAAVDTTSVVINEFSIRHGDRLGGAKQSVMQAMGVPLVTVFAQLGISGLTPASGGMQRRTYQQRMQDFAVVGLLHEPTQKWIEVGLLLNPQNPWDFLQVEPEAAVVVCRDLLSVALMSAARLLEDFKEGKLKPGEYLSVWLTVR